jgi:hypothetical protein
MSKVESSPEQYWVVPKFSVGKTAILVIIMLAWEGLIPALLMQPVYIGKQLVSATILGGLGIWGLLKLRRGFTITKDGIGAMAALGYAVAVTLVYSVMQQHLPPSEWLLAMYMLLPLAIFPLLSLLGVSWREVFAGIIISASICSVVSIADQFGHFPMFDQFVRGSINNKFARRMFLMRVETACAVLMLLSWVSLYFYRPRAILYGILLALVAFVLFRVSESRQSMTAVLIGFAFFVAVGGLNFKQLVRRIPLFVLVVLPVLIILLMPYITKLLGAENYMREGNIDIRIQSMDFYWNQFKQTGGVGFGVLSGGDDARNFFAMAQRHGNGSWPFYLADTGILSALYQFGWGGLAFAIGMPIWLGIRFIRLGRNLPAHVRVFPMALGCFLLGSVIHPWPQNYFTLDWSIMFGALSWYACSDLEARVKAHNRSKQRVVVRPKDGKGRGSRAPGARPKPAPEGAVAGVSPEAAG